MQNEIPDWLDRFSPQMFLYWLQWFVLVALFAMHMSASESPEMECGSECEAKAPVPQWERGIT